MKRMNEMVQKRRHNERCKDCKNVIIKLFKKMFDDVEVNYQIKIPTEIEGYEGEPYYEDLKRIFTALQKERGNSDFIRVKTLPNCDLFIPNPGFVVELDESQHFTALRKLALSLYPENFRLGFNIEKWKNLCDKINAKDNDPVYRDEQRAWYDTLRDFLPAINGFKPTIRLYLAEHQWCSLDVEKDADIFKSWLPEHPSLKTEIKRTETGNVIVATVVIQSNEKPTNEGRLELLNKVLNKLKNQVDAVIFPAGFFKTSENADTLFDGIVKDVKKFLQPGSCDASICFGIDGLDGKDQVALAVDGNGIIAAGRKFHPTKDDIINKLESAENHQSTENGYKRIFNIKGKNIFLAVCYDSYGIRHKKIDNPGVDAIFNLVHGFNPKGSAGSSDTYFAKHGFAGASKQWKCPVFAAAVFHNRQIPDRWPTGIFWNQNDKSTRNWKYENNPISPIKRINVRFANKSKENADIRLYELR